MRALAVLAVLGGLAGAARADEVDELVAQGQAAAQRREFEPAITFFKRADAKQPRALHACHIGLTYLRFGNLTLSELYLERCRKRARDADLAPAWYAEAARQLTDALAAADVLALTVRVLPAGVPATFELAFAPGDSFEPQTIHLLPGTYELGVRAAGFVPATVTVEVTGKGERALDVTLEREGAAPPPVVTVPPVVARAPAPDDTRRRWSTRLLVTGGIAAGAAVALHAFAYHQRGQLDDATTVADYRDHETAFDVARAGTFTLYGVAAVAAGVGLYLRLTGSTAQVSGAVTRDAGVVTLSWTR